MHQRNKTFLKSVQRYKTLSLYCMVYYMVFSVTNRSRKGFSTADFPQQGFPGKDSLQLIFRNEFFTFKGYIWYNGCYGFRFTNTYPENTGSVFGREGI